jgi:UDP-2,3-diacylglucosamine pyrophosphatase LpxH
MDQYDELYVISDIHLGGEKSAAGNFQIFNQGNRLKNFINKIRLSRPKEKVSLVLNGDIFDSLAEKDVEGYVAVSETEALNMMKRIFKDVSFKSAWQALQKFIEAPHRYLVFVIGNHDIELALPVVQDFLKSTLAKGDPERQSRMIFATTGAGYSCMVGNARVYCTHGNEMDDFNWVDYNLLGQLANAMNAGRSIANKDWKPNAGTRLVVDVMNIVKQRYPFVDVLKPEANAIAAILLTLDKETFSKIDLSDGIPIMRDKWKGRSVTANLLGDMAENGLAPPRPQMMEAYLSHVVGRNLGEEIQSRGTMLAEDELLQDAEENLDITDSEYEGTSEEGTETLGWFDVVLGRVGLTSKKKALRRALQDWNDQQEDFAIDHKDTLFTKIQDRTGPDVDFVITGHTHMPRALPMQHHGYYYNTGTWIRTYRFTKACLDDKAHFEKTIWPKLKTGTLEELDNLPIRADGGGPSKKQKLLFDRSSAVRISAKGPNTTGDLLRITDAKNATTVKLELEPGTKSYTK